MKKTTGNICFKSLTVIAVLLLCGTLHSQSSPTIIIDSLNDCHLKTNSEGVEIDNIFITKSLDEEDPELADQIFLSEYNKGEKIELEYMIVSHCSDSIVISNCLNNDTLNLIVDYDNSIENECSQVYVLKISWKVPFGKSYTYLFNSIDLSRKFSDPNETLENERDEFGNIIRTKHYYKGNLQFEEISTYNSDQNLISKTELDGDGNILRVFEYTSDGKLSKEIKYLDGVPHRTINY